MRTRSTLSPHVYRPVAAGWVRPSRFKSAAPTPSLRDGLAATPTPLSPPTPPRDLPPLSKIAITSVGENLIKTKRLRWILKAMARIPKIGKKFRLQNFIVEKALPEHYLKYATNLATRIRRQEVPIGETIARAKAEGKEVYTTQVRLGLPHHRKATKASPTFLGIIADPLSQLTQPDSLLDIIFQKARAKHGQFRLALHDPNFLRERAQEVFRELVRELVFDPFIYRFLLGQSAIFDFSGTQQNWENVKVLTTGTPIQDEYLKPILKVISEKVTDRLTDRLIRMDRACRAKDDVIRVFGDHYEETLKHQDHVMFQEFPCGHEPCSIAILGLRETEFDIRLSSPAHSTETKISRRHGDHFSESHNDIFAELWKFCHHEIEGLGRLAIHISFDSKGRAQVELDTPWAENDATSAVWKNNIKEFILNYLSYFNVSDLHFQSGQRLDKFFAIASRPKHFMKFLRAVIATRSTLILNGDIIDDLREMNASGCLRSEHYKPILDLLKQVRRIIYIPGNHDRILKIRYGDVEIETLNYSLRAWQRKIRKKYGTIAGAFAFSITWPAFLYAGVQEKRNYSYARSLRDEIRELLPRAHITPYFVDQQKGLIFEHGDAPDAPSMPRVMQKLFVIFWQKIIAVKSWIDRLLLVRRFNPLYYVPGFKNFVRWFTQFDVDQWIEDTYFFWRIVFFPGPLFNGKIGALMDHYIVPSSRIQTVGEMFHWYTQQRFSYLTQTWGHKHQVERRGSGLINEVLRKLLQSDQSGREKPPRLLYVNGGHWSAPYFLSSYLERSGAHITPKSPQVLGTAVYYSAAHPHEVDILRFEK